MWLINHKLLEGLNLQIKTLRRGKLFLVISCYFAMVILHFIRLYQKCFYFISRLLAKLNSMYLSKDYLLHMDACSYQCLKAPAQAHSVSFKPMVTGSNLFSQSLWEGVHYLVNHFNKANMLKPSVMMACNVMLVQPSMAFRQFHLQNFTHNAWVSQQYGIQALYNCSAGYDPLPNLILPRRHHLDKSTMCMWLSD